MNSRDLFEFALPSPGSLFVIVDPIATVPAFLAMTPRDSREQRIKAAHLPCFMVAVVLLLFAAAGKSIFKFFAIIMPAFQIAASIVLLIVVLDMLRAQRSRMQEMTKEASASAEEAGLANTRLAIPMLAGPSAISRAILLQNQPVGIVTPIVLHGSIAAVSFASNAISAPFGAGRAVAQPDCDQRCHPHHRPVTGSRGGSVFDQQIEGFEDGIPSPMSSLGDGSIARGTDFAL